MPVLRSLYSQSWETVWTTSLYVYIDYLIL